MSARVLALLLLAAVAVSGAAAQGPVVPAVLDAVAASPAARGPMTIAGYEVRSDDLWITATAVCCSVACGTVGCFLVLRRMSLLGDAISHAILPGLAIAFMVTHSREPWAMLGGALVVGVITALLSTGLSRWGRVPEDAAMGVVFTTLFALGVVLITAVARDVDLDPGCVLYGLIEFSPYDTVGLWGAEVPRSLVWLGAVLAVNTALIAVFFKELRIVCFDPYLATTMGISATLVHYALMTGVAATCVASFESVGSILVVAMLVAPGATAHLLTDRLARMLWIAAAVAAVSAVVGYALAVWLNTSVAGMIASVAFAIFILAAFLAPRRGYLAKALRRALLSLRICQEDVLGLLYRWHEQTRGTSGGGRALTADQIATATRAGAQARLAVWLLARRGLLERRAAGEIAPTAAGLEAASGVVRAHRLWETYLARHLGVASDRLHGPAHRTEHFLSRDLQDRVDAQVLDSTDPHGKPIPPRAS